MTGGIRVLHVDDDPDLASLVAIHLERADADIEVVSAGSVSEATALLDDTVDCIVSDYEMPGATGLDLLRTVREEYPSLPFVLFTRRGSEEIAGEAIAAGVTDYIQKTIGPEGYSLLANRVRNAVEQYRALQAREAGDARLRALVEASSDVVGIVGADGSFEYVSPSATNVLGYDPSTLVGTDAFGYVHPDDLDDSFAEFERLLADPEHVSLITFRFRHDDGSWVRIEALARNLFDDPAVEGIVVNTRDISERHERERDLAQYETIVETIPGGVFVLGVGGRIVQLNRAGADMLGVDRDDVVGAPAARLVDMGVFDPGVPALYAELVEELRDDDAPRPTRDVEFRVTRPDGGERTLDVTLTPRPGPAFTGVIGVMVDATDRVRDTARIAAERDRFAVLFENASDPIVAVVFEDGVPVVDAVNPAFERVFGYDEADLVGRPSEEYVPRGEWPTAQDLVERTLAGETVSTEIVRETVGGPRQFEVRGGSIAESDGAVRAYAIYTDVTARRERERTVERLHAATRRLLRAETPERVAEVTADAVEAVLGYPVTGVRLLSPDGDALVLAAATEQTSAVMGHRPVYPLDDTDAPVVRAFHAGETVVCDDLDVLTDGYDRGPLGSALYLPLGAYGTLSIGQFERGGFDDDAVRVAEALAANVGATLARLDREQALRDRERDLERENERLDSFASLVSHDLRNPLTVAGGQLELARETGAPESFDAAANALDRMNELVDGILTLAREGRAVGDPRPVVLTPLVHEAWGMTGMPADALTTADLGEVEADPERLRTLFENLFGNVREHAGPDANVLVERTGTGFAVEDDGDGIPPADHERVFETGYSTRRDGTGFGLAIVRSIAEAHGWTVTATDGVDGGARFEFGGVVPLDLQAGH